MCKMPNQLLKYQAASKQIKNAINPLMLDQKSPPWFQTHDARGRSGITVNLCYYKCASFPLLCFHTAGRGESSELCGLPGAEQIHQGRSQVITARLSGNIGKAGEDQEVPLWADLALGPHRTWCPCQGIWFPKFPRQVHNPSWDQAKAAHFKGGKKRLVNIWSDSTSSPNSLDGSNHNISPDFLSGFHTHWKKSELSLLSSIFTSFSELIPYIYFTALLKFPFFFKRYAFVFLYKINWAW